MKGNNGHFEMKELRVWDREGERNKRKMEKKIVVCIIWHLRWTLFATMHADEMNEMR